MSRRNSLPTAWLKEEATRLRTLEDRIKPAMDAVMEVAFTDTQAAVHVFSGALKASGSWSSEVTDGEYVGEISYGGAMAPHAVYELNRKGHSTLDEVLPRHEPAFEDAIRSALDT